MGKLEQIELLQKVYQMVNNKQTITNLEIAQIRDYVDMVRDALIDELREDIED